MNARSVNTLLLVLLVVLMGTITVLTLRLQQRPEAAELNGGKSSTNQFTRVAVRKVNATNFLTLPISSLEWARLESTNYPVFIANLRAIGCPEETIRDILIADIAKLYAQRRAALRGGAEAYKYWLTGDAWERGVRSPQQQRQLRALEAEERQLVKELLGVDLQTELARLWDGDDAAERTVGFLPTGKKAQVLALQGRFEALEQEIYERSRGITDDDDQAALRQLEKQREAELAKLLTPEEMQEYELRNSATANSLRYSLNGFEPSAEEFRNLFSLQKTFDEAFNQDADLDDPAKAEKRARAQQEAQELLNQEIKDALGEKRFAEYQRVQDPDYKTLAQVAERYDLSKEVTTRVYDMKRIAEEQKLAVQNNPNFTPEQRQKAIAGIAKETERSLGEVMGPKVFKAYRRFGGNWIRNLGVSAGDESEFDFNQ